MGDDYQLTGGAFNFDFRKSQQFARELGLDPRRIYANLDALIAAESALPAAERVKLVTVATPNYLHFDMASRLIQAGFHVLCEKPVTSTAAEAETLANLLKARQQVFAVAHTYTGYPMVRQMRGMIAAGAIGPIQKVAAQYYQGWINAVIHDPVKRKTVWRLDPAKSGQSSCIGDIGVHAFNLLEYTTGLQIEQALSDIDTLYPDNSLDVDGTVLLRLGPHVKGVLCASQIATAEENNLTLAVYGRTGALKWAQENPNQLEFLQEGKPLTLLKAGHEYNLPPARAATKLPAGHPEGFIDAMGNLYRGVAKAINGQAVDAGAYPGIDSGVRGMRFIEAVLRSSRNGNVWVKL
ncbi:MAG: Gfo/Idh/MocA family oxidoreductase [Proteobacteria bacterium]|nr:Gfo/Idh/MocA family oxidoreductase [Pseudomonadota bacterium]